MKKSIIRICCFLAILALILAYCNSVFKFKYGDGISIVTSFYEQDKNTVDVLVLGSSHAHVNFSNGTLWREFGIASFDLGGSVQPFWNSYYNLKEALKTQTPELIILDAYAASFDFEYSDDSRIIKNVYGLKWSQNKLDALRASVEKERLSEFLLDYSQYHNRYSNLSKADFSDDYGSKNMDCNWFGTDWKGQYLFNSSNHEDMADVSFVDHETPLAPKTEEYYRKIIELAQSKAIPILVVVTPYSSNEHEQSTYIAAEKIANEYGVEFINYNLKLDEIGFDYDSDFHDSEHMTSIGASKFSRYVGEYLKSHYTISDHRGDPKYNTWDRWADYNDQFENGERIIETANPDMLGELLDNENYYVFISIDGSCDPSNEWVRRFLNRQGIYEDHPVGIWMVQGGNVLYKSGVEDYEQYFSNERRDFCIKHNEGYNLNDVIIDNVSYEHKVENGINITVYDNLTNMIVTSFGIDYYNNFEIVR